MMLQSGVREGAQCLVTCSDRHETDEDNEIGIHTSFPAMVITDPHSLIVEKMTS